MEPIHNYFFQNIANHTFLLNAAGLCFIQHAGADRNARMCWDSTLVNIKHKQRFRTQTFWLMSIQIHSFWSLNCHLGGNMCWVWSSFWVHVWASPHSGSAFLFSSVFLCRRSSFEGWPQAPLPVPVLIFLLLVFVVVLLLVFCLQPQDGSSSHQSHQEEAERGPGGQRHGRQRARGKDEPVVCHTAVSAHAVLFCRLISWGAEVNFTK